jgi:hypothetical protein
MKPLKNNNVVVVILMAALLCGVGCSNDDNSSKQEPVNFQYAADSLTVSFKTEGEIPQPQILWPAAKGNFSLEEAPKGLEINTLTGAISWNHDLPFGVHDITVKAISEGQSWYTSFVLTNTFNASFWNGSIYPLLSLEENRPNYHLWLYKDHSIRIYDVANEMDSAGTGFWEVKGDSIFIEHCTYCPDITSDQLESTPYINLMKGRFHQEGDTPNFNGKIVSIKPGPIEGMIAIEPNFYFDWD